ncbi:hypothetical protein [Thermoactinomyces sp. DSM 45892]|uniref:hypothetical protein n=1 Tax=Thermoactinomyces sp. DSM 45892 TaxID=1882753 RepID=UPI00089C47AE|nr:hypothetical protein [Thermoactinomyces sp. DSM 45892]SDY83427.1 hypothetical protein SAMN05444416_10926 [Thermoactinomyces sp. DSM 45892]
MAVKTIYREISIDCDSCYMKYVIGAKMNDLEDWARWEPVEDASCPCCKSENLDELYGLVPYYQAKRIGKRAYVHSKESAEWSNFLDFCYEVARLTDYTLDKLIEIIEEESLHENM